MTLPWGPAMAVHAGAVAQLMRSVLCDHLIAALPPGRTASIISVHSLNNVPSQVNTPIDPEIPGSMRDNFRRFWAVLYNFGRF